VLGSFGGEGGGFKLLGGGGEEKKGSLANLYASVFCCRVY